MTRDIAQVTALGATASKIATVSSRPNKQNRSARSSMPLLIPLGPRPCMNRFTERPERNLTRTSRSPGSAEQDAILREAMQSRLSIRPGQVSPQPDDPRPTGSIGGGGDPRTMAAFPPDVQPETGPKKELPAQFRRTLVDYHTKEPAGRGNIRNPQHHLLLLPRKRKARRRGVGAR